MLREILVKSVMYFTSGKYLNSSGVLRSLLLITVSAIILTSTASATTVTSISNGNWSDSGVWDRGVPVGDDVVIIDKGHEIVFDVDQSDFTVGVDITINGTLNCSTAVGFYYLKSSSNIDGSGLLQAGVSKVVPLPSNVTFTIDLDGHQFREGISLDVQLYCTEPRNKYVSFINNESVGATNIEVDTDISGDIWSAGGGLLVRFLA